MIRIFMLVILVLQVFPISPREPHAGTDEELSPAIIMERLAQVSREGLEVIEKVKTMMPQIQKNLSAKTLGEAVEDCVSGQCESTVYPIGWEATRGEGPRWRIFFYFKDEAERYLKAAWEYNEDRNALIPAEFTNATKFWVKRTKNFRP